MKTVDIKIDERIVLPESCDNMSPDLRGHVIAALSDSCVKFECEYSDLRWSVIIDPASGQPIIKVKKRKDYVVLNDLPLHHLIGSK